MGGPGSGRRRTRAKQVVENCIVLSSAELQRRKLLRPNFQTVAEMICPPPRAGDTPLSIHCEVDTFDPHDASLKLHYRPRTDEGPVELRVQLTTTPLPWGGVRWWFICPLKRGGQESGRRCDKLYLPPRAGWFGCRKCYDLTYRSCRQTRAGGQYGAVAAALGIPADMVRNLLQQRRRRSPG